MSDKRVLTIANHLGSVGGTESAQLAIFQNLAERGWEVDLLYVSQGNYWLEWKALATTTTQIRASIPTRSSPAASSMGTIRGAISGRGRRRRSSMSTMPGMCQSASRSVLRHAHQWLRICIYRRPFASRPG